MRDFGLISILCQLCRYGSAAASVGTHSSSYRIIAPRRVGLSPATCNTARIETMNKPGKKKSVSTIAVNKKARHDYFIEQTFECGMVLEGWEAKSLRAGRAQITETYVFLKNGEAWVTGAHITPLNTASTHINPDPTRTRKLLLNRKELDKMVGAVERKGYTLVALSLYWSKGRAKLEIGLAKGKKQHDKRASDKDRDWKRQKARILKAK